MKYTLVVRQAAALEAGLVGKVSFADLGLLDYLRGWFFCEGAEIRFVEGKKCVWLRCERAIEELPLLFNPKAQIRSRKNQLTALIQKLRKAGLVETHKIGRRLFFRLTDKAIELTKRRQHQGQDAAKTAPIVPSSHDETVTTGQDKIVTSLRDEYLPANIDETGTKESERKETPPSSPCEGEAGCILAFWNSFPQLPPVLAITPNRAGKIRKRLADPWWREHWREGIQRAAASRFLTGNGSHGWQATLDWFLGGDSLVKIMEGAYDNRPEHVPKPMLSDVKAQLKAVDELIAKHPANDESGAYAGDATGEQWEDLQKLRQRREQLLQQLASLS